MSAGASGYEIDFPEGYFGQLEEDTPAGGWLEVTVRAADGKSGYRVAFYDAVRLKQTCGQLFQQSPVEMKRPTDG
jgi:hypothetical protein